MAQEIAGCPLCGNPPEVGVCSVECRDCGLSLRRKVNGLKFGGKHKIEVDREPCWKMLVRWNTRNP